MEKKGLGNPSATVVYLLLASVLVAVILYLFTQIIKKSG